MPSFLLAQAQHALARKKRGSGRRKKAVKRVARLHRKERSQRNDSLHKWSRCLVNTSQPLVFEEQASANLSKRPKPKQDTETGQYLQGQSGQEQKRKRPVLCRS